MNLILAILIPALIALFYIHEANQLREEQRRIQEDLEESRRKSGWYDYYW